MIKKKIIDEDLSWISFNLRVLEEGIRSDNLLMEQIKFLSIVSINFEEFFKVRIPKIYKKNYLFIDKVNKNINKITKLQYFHLFNLLKKAENNGIFKLITYDKSTTEEKQQLNIYFLNNIYKTLSPIVIGDYKRFSKRLKSGLINIIIELETKEKKIKYSIIQIEQNRLIEITENKFILIEEIIKNNLNLLFCNYKIKSFSSFRITRNENLYPIKKKTSFLKEVKKAVMNVDKNQIVRLEVEKNINKQTNSFLKRIFKITSTSVYYFERIIDLSFLMGIYNANSWKGQKLKEIKPLNYKEMQNEKIFKEISKKDILLQHPWESHEHVINFLETASMDHEVIDIKQTIYRADSRVISALKTAASNGKTVTVIIELLAQFDEENNIKWAKDLEKAGCKVIYGIGKLITHGKFILITRKEKKEINQYLHIGTGNYNNKSNSIFVDNSFFTKNKEFCSDIDILFNNLITGFRIKELKRIIASPFNTRKELYKRIEREKENAKKGIKAKILIKVNGLTDKEIIKKLYNAAICGVKIVLIVRGSCSAKSSKNLKIYSLVGRFLEHSRFFYFENEGKQDILMGSIDCVFEKIENRIDILYPLLEKENKIKMNILINDMLKDNVRLRIQKKNTIYYPVSCIHKKKYDYQNDYCNKIFN